MGQPVVHFEVVGKDFDKLKSFYSEVAGWDYQEAPAADQEGVPPYAMVPQEANTNPDGIGIGGGIGVGPEGYEGHVTFYIEVPDVGASLDQAEKLGGTKVMGPESMTEDLTIGLFNDPEGHLVGLVQSQQS
jgi:predicted enzyme related to lactoylglutathione lyase